MTQALGKGGNFHKTRQRYLCYGLLACIAELSIIVSDLDLVSMSCDVTTIFTIEVNCLYFLKHRRG